MFNRNGESARLQTGDWICFRQAPGAGTQIFFRRPSEGGGESEESQRLILTKYRLPLFKMSFFSFEECGDLADLIADTSDLAIGASKMAERGDLRTAEFEVRARE